MQTEDSNPNITVYESKIVYPDFKTRLKKYTVVRFFGVAVLVQAVAIPIVAFYLEEPLILIFWVMLGINYFTINSFRSWVRYYIERIELDNEKGLAKIKFYDKDSSQEATILLNRLQIKLKPVSSRGAKNSLYFYEGDKLICHQLIDVGHWTEANCAPVYKAFKAN